MTTDYTPIDKVLQLRNWMSRHTECKHSITKALLILCDHSKALKENKEFSIQKCNLCGKDADFCICDGMY